MVVRVKCDRFNRACIRSIGDRLFHSVAQGGQFSTGGHRIISYTSNRGITAQNMEKLQVTDFNKDTSFESASVACSNVYRCERWTLRKNE